MAGHGPQRVPAEPSGPAVDEREPERRRIASRHRNLPVLEALGFVEWDEAADASSEEPRFDDIRPLSTLLDEHQD